MIVNKQSLVSRISTDLRDNSLQEISPRDVRHSLLDIIDSVHLFTADQDLNAANFSTPATRTTRAGQEALGKLSLAGYSSVDNSAFGFSALGGNYIGNQNTAIGVYSLGCNVYGDDNVAVGYHSLAGNIFGSGNVALGSHSLQTNKRGNFNIAIGHGAGYYIEETDSYKLFIASHDIDNEGICDVVAGIGPSPLIYGDLQSLQMGIGVKSLHDYGTLQVSGAISPSTDSVYDLGASLYKWKSINNEIFFNDANSVARVSGNIVPDTTDIYSLGLSSPKLLWDGAFNNILVSGSATINELLWTTQTNCLYECKTLYLASSGICTPDSPCGYLSDTQLEGGGFIIQSSGVDYKRDYHWTYLSPDYSQTCVEPNLNLIGGDIPAYARSAWYSNISLVLESGRHVKADRHIGRDNLSLVTENNCYGLFLKKKVGEPVDKVSVITYLAEEGLITPDPLASDGTLGNIGDVNLISSGLNPDYTVALSSTVSGVSVGQRFLARTSTTKESEPSGEKVVGFDLRYVDEKDEIDTGTNQEKDRFTISAYNKSKTPVNALTIMRNRSGGSVGITDVYGDVFPETLLNVQGTGITETRVTGGTEASIQVLGGSNKVVDGGEIRYSISTQRLDINVFRDSQKHVAISIASGNHNVGIGLPNTYPSGAPERLSVASGIDNTAAIAMEETSITDLPGTSGWGKLYVKESLASNQEQSIYFVDGSGNEFDLIKNKFAQTGDNVYTDVNYNTHVGDYSPNARGDIIDNTQYKNTTLGHSALKNLASGDSNIAIGWEAGKNVTTGDNNIFIGNQAGENVTTASGNLIIGNEDDIIISGVMNPTRHLTFPKTKLSITSEDEFDKLTLGYNTFDLTDNANRYPDQAMTFNFIGPDGDDVLRTEKLFTLSHTVAAMTNSASYSNPDPLRPYAQLEGDLRLRGALRFSDGTNLDTVADLTVEQGSGIKTTQPASANTTVHLDIDNLPAVTSDDVHSLFSYLPIASGTSHGKINITTLNDILTESGPRILECTDGQTGSNYLFTSTSDLGGDGCGTVYMGTQAGHLSNGWNDAVMIGTQAGRGATIPTVSQSEHASVFIGHQAGEDTIGCYGSTFIGPNAGWNADNSYRSVFLGDEAGMNASTNRSVGIGDNALEGVSGVKNLEITTGVGGFLTSRLVTGEVSNKINIGDFLAGDMSEKRLSIGQARVSNIGSTLEIRPTTDSEKIQVWYDYGGTEKAYLDQDGNLGIVLVEGISADDINPPSNSASPTTGNMVLKNSSWANGDTVTLTNRDTTLTIPTDTYVIAIRINGEYRPIWLSCP